MENLYPGNDIVCGLRQKDSDDNYIDLTSYVEIMALIYTNSEKTYKFIYPEPEEEQEGEEEEEEEEETEEEYALDLNDPTEAIACLPGTISKNIDTGICWCEWYIKTIEQDNGKLVLKQKIYNILPAEISKKI